MSRDPKFGSDKFQCPHCGVFAQHNWLYEGEYSRTVIGLANIIYYNKRPTIPDYGQKFVENFIKWMSDDLRQQLRSYIHPDIAYATCASCKAPSLWIKDKMVYPENNSIELPNDDLADEIKELYNEAVSIIGKSPKGATALLRLGLQKLLIQIGCEGKNINDDIRKLVANGLSPKIQQALDSLRVVGNNAVHPGLIDLNDNREIAYKLFRMLNFIANELITKPKELSSFYEEVVPESIREHIAKVDSK